MLPKKQRNSDCPLQIRGVPLLPGDGLAKGSRNLLSRQQQLELRAISESIEYRHGEMPIFNEGEDAQFVYAIGAGAIRLGRHSETGRRQIVELLFAGDFFGFPEHGKYVNFSEVVRPSLLYRISLAQLLKLARTQQEFQLVLLARVAFDLRRTQRRVIMLAHQNASQRLASFLLDLLQHPEFCNEDGQISLPMTMVELADYLGISPETVTRVFARLEEGKLIQWASKRTLAIVNQESLQRLIRGRRRSAPELD